MLESGDVGICRIQLGKPIGRVFRVAAPTKRQRWWEFLKIYPRGLVDIGNSHKLQALFTSTRPLTF